MRNRRRARWVLCGALAQAGCYAGQQHFDGGGGPEGNAPGGGEAGEEDGADEGASAGGPPAASCDEGPHVATAPLRRLTKTEYDNTIRDLLQDDRRLAQSFSDDEVVGGFAANSVAPISGLALDQYMDAAEVLSLRAVEERWDEVVGCDAAQPSCVADFVAEFGARAFRRPLSASEQDDYVALFEESASEWDSAKAMGMVIQAMLMSPYFLYHAEPQGEAGVQLASPYATASRLSYFLWASMPDDALMEAAASGSIHDEHELERQARRMLDDPRAADTIAAFHRQWLHIEGLSQKVRDPELFPDWDPSLVGRMQEETVRFADEVIRRGEGDLHTLLTASWTMADAELAEHYGVESRGDGFQRVELPADERAGVLTQGSVMVANAHPDGNSWAHRGLLVREQLMCQGPLAVPPDVNVAEEDANDPERVNNPSCKPCHELMDFIGFGFDHYDAVGAFSRVGPNGDDIDAVGKIINVEGIEDFAFDGAIELVNTLADEPRVQQCVAKHWFSYATRREVGPDEQCEVDRLVAAFQDSGGDIRELMIDVAVSDAMRYQANL